MIPIIIASLILGYVSAKEPDIQSYVQEFRYEFNVEVTNPIYFEWEPHKSYEGYCLLGTGEIVINKYYWDRLDDHKKRYLIFHELGHCALGMRHSEDDDIMFPYGYVSAEETWPKYLDKMKRRWAQEREDDADPRNGE